MQDEGSMRQICVNKRMDSCDTGGYVQYGVIEMTNKSNNRVIQRAEIVGFI